MTISPISDWVMIEPARAAAITAGGIFIPDAARGKQCFGKVLAVGPGKLLPDGVRSGMVCRVGDTVRFLKHAERKAEADEREYSFVREGELMTVNGMPIGGTCIIIKAPDEGKVGSIFIPQAAQRYKRQGWVVATGGGTTLEDGTVVPLPFKPGDYLIAERHFVRPDESEDEISQDPVTVLVRDDEPVGFIAREDCGGPYELSEEHATYIEQYGHTGAQETAVGRRIP